MRHRQLKGAVLEKDKLRKYAASFTETPEFKMHSYAAMGAIYTLFAVAWFLVDAIFGIAWRLLAVVVWLLTYLNWSKSKGTRRFTANIRARRI